MNWKVASGVHGGAAAAAAATRMWERPRSFTFALSLYVHRENFESREKGKGDSPLFSSTSPFTLSPWLPGKRERKKERNESRKRREREKFTSWTNERRATFTPKGTDCGLLRASSWCFHEREVPPYTTVHAYLTAAYSEPLGPVAKYKTLRVSQ